MALMLAPDPAPRQTAGITGIARTVGAALSPLIAGPLYAAGALASLNIVAIPSPSVHCFFNPSELWG
jgi:hypothetical protein